MAGDFDEGKKKIDFDGFFKAIYPKNIYYSNLQIYLKNHLISEHFAYIHKIVLSPFVKFQ